MTTITVKVSKKFQIAVPALARERLNIHNGDHLIVDIQDGMILLLPQPENYSSHLAGLHREIWEGTDASYHIDRERGEWES